MKIKITREELTTRKTVLCFTEAMLMSVLSSSPPCKHLPLSVSLALSILGFFAFSGLAGIWQNFVPIVRRPYLLVSFIEYLVNSNTNSQVANYLCLLFSGCGHHRIVFGYFPFSSYSKFSLFLYWDSYLHFPADRSLAACLTSGSPFASKKHIIRCCHNINDKRWDTRTLLHLFIFLIIGWFLKWTSYEIPAWRMDMN